MNPKALNDFGSNIMAQTHGFRKWHLNAISASVFCISADWQLNAISASVFRISATWQATMQLEYRKL